MSAPILSIVYGFSYGAFYELRYDPLHILGFIAGHVALLLIFAGLLLPRWFDVFIPPQRRAEGNIDNGAFAPAMEELVADDDAESARKVDSGNNSDLRLHDKDEALVTPPAGTANDGVVRSGPPPQYNDITTAGGNGINEPVPAHTRTTEKF